MRRTVIDGYNLLLRDADPGRSLRDLRDEFLRRVDAARSPAEAVTVVFDGRPQGGGRQRPAESLDVRYSRSPRTADDLIISIVKAEPRNQVTVLTRDRELAHRVRAAGGLLGDIGAFFRGPKRRSSGPAPREKPGAPRGRELDEWERLFEEGEERPD